MTAAEGTAIDRWVREFRGPLVGLCLHWGMERGEAQVLAVDALAEAWIGRGRFEGDPADLEAVGAWLRGIAFHLWRTRARKAERRREEVLAASALAEVQPEERVDERRDALEAAFARLPAEQREILRVRYLEESGLRAVAALLGITPKAAEQRLFRARKALRELALRELSRGARGVGR